MDIFFADPTDIPLPPDEVRIRLLHAEPFNDATRVKVTLELDPFQKRPNLELILISPSGREVASTEIIESFTRKMELIMHLRSLPEPGDYLLSANLYYADLPELPKPDFTPEPESSPLTSVPPEPPQSPELPEPAPILRRQVDSALFRFSLS